jgi:hypothetical protein
VNIVLSRGKPVSIVQSNPICVGLFININLLPLNKTNPFSWTGEQPEDDSEGASSSSVPVNDQSEEKPKKPANLVTTWGAGIKKMTGRDSILGGVLNTKLNKVFFSCGRLVSAPPAVAFLYILSLLLTSFTSPTSLLLQGPD